MSVEHTGVGKDEGFDLVKIAEEGSGQTSLKLYWRGESNCGG